MAEQREEPRFPHQVRVRPPQHDRGAVRLEGEREQRRHHGARSQLLYAVEANRRRHGLLQRGGVVRREVRSSASGRPDRGAVLRLREGQRVLY